jgi:hypothetical protein
MGRFRSTSENGRNRRSWISGAIFHRIIAAIHLAVVSIGTGIETALKPSAKHKAHYVYSDLYTSLRLKALATDPANTAEVRAIQAELAQLDGKYQQEQF